MHAMQDERGAPLTVRPLDREEASPPRARLAGFAIGVAVLTLLVDQVSKLWALRSLTPGESIEIVGDLSLHGVTAPVTLVATFEGSVTDPWGNDRIGFTASGELDRETFGLTWNAALETGGVVVGKQVQLEIEAEFVKA